jgi:GAF domain
MSEVASEVAAPIAAAKKTFIKATEFWVPSRDRSFLEYGGGLYGTATRFGALSRTLCFARGEGLPGQAWEAGHPIVLRQFVGTYFQRTSAAHAEGLTCAIAMPIFAGDFLTSVLVIFCGDNDEDQAGAIELWHNDPAQSKDMTLVDGHYGNTGDAFEFISRRTSFRRDHGLPGACWGSGMPVFLEDLGKASGFLRGDSAVKVGINRGFAVPCPAARGQMFVLAFLSARATPIARRVEVWERLGDEDAASAADGAAGPQLRRVSGFCEALGSLAASTQSPSLEFGQGTIGQVLLTGVPGISSHADTEPVGLGVAAKEAGLKSLAAIPVIRYGRTVACVALYF